MRRLIGAIVVLVTLFVLADRLTVGYAQRQVAKSVQQTERLASEPSVKIRGFPFLTQLVRGRYSDVDVTVRGYQRAPAIPLEELDVHLRGARVPLAQIRGTVSRVPVERVTATARIGYGAFGNAHAGLSFGYAGNNKVRVSGRVTVAGQPLRATATGRVRTVGNALSVVIDTVDPAGAAGAAAREVFGVRTPLPALPFHFRLTSVRATPAGIELTGSADNVVLTASGAKRAVR